MSRTVRGLCANCGRLKRQEDIDFADTPSIRFSVFGDLTSAALYGLVAIVGIATAIGLMIWLAVNLLVVVLVVAVLIAMVLALGEILDW